MSSQKIVIEIINAKIEISIVTKNEPKENEFKTPERKRPETIIVPDAPKRRKLIKYPFDISSLDSE